jgi:single-strand DNA-binding protein
MSVADINSVVLVGRLTRDMELSHIPSGTAVGKMSIAVNRSVKKGDKWESEASFFDITIWGKTSEALAQYLTKGTRIGVQGELEQERWNDKDGKPHSRVKITAHNIQLLGSGKGTDDKQKDDVIQASTDIPAPGNTDDDSIPF